ncbi:hypothetical protein M3J09_007822 [Ascochyta lentis]
MLLIDTKLFYAGESRRFKDGSARYFGRHCIMVWLLKAPIRALADRAQPSSGEGTQPNVPTENRYQQPLCERLLRTRDYERVSVRPTAQSKMYVQSISLASSAGWWLTSHHIPARTSNP